MTFDQPTVFDALADLERAGPPAPPRARTADPVTSHAAAASIDPAAITDTHARVLSLLAEGPATDEQLAARWDRRYPDVYVSASGLRTRRRELVDLELVVPRHDLEGRTRSGRAATVWSLP